MEFADPAVDFAMLARSLGVEAVRLAGPAGLREALAAAFRRPGTKLLEVMVDGSVQA